MFLIRRCFGRSQAASEISTIRLLDRMADIFGKLKKNVGKLP
jgi:hypothetical protein